MNYVKSEWKLNSELSDAHLRRFLSCKSAKDFRKLFDLPFQELQEHINAPKYKRYSISKKRGGKREILEPVGRLKPIQKILNYHLQLSYQKIKPDNVHGFTLRDLEGPDLCNIALNAKHHVGRAFVMNIDLKNFFPSISAKQVYRCLSSDVFSFPEEIARAIALLCTYQGKLPTGAPSSPVLSNLVCLQLDKELNELAKEFNWRYSRYADDLSFSANEYIFKAKVDKVFGSIVKQNFEVNLGKFRIQSQKVRQQVTGITVNQNLNVNRQFLKKTRAMIHSLYYEGPQAAANKHFQSMLNVSEKDVATFLNRIQGNLLFIQQVLGPDNPILVHMKDQLEMHKHFF